MTVTPASTTPTPGTLTISAGHRGTEAGEGPFTRRPRLRGAHAPHAGPLGLLNGVRGQRATFMCTGLGIRASLEGSVS